MLANHWFAGRTLPRRIDGAGVNEPLVRRPFIAPRVAGHESHFRLFLSTGKAYPAWIGIRWALACTVWLGGAHRGGYGNHGLYR